MNQRVVIFDDIQTQAEQLCRALDKFMPNIDFTPVYTEESIIKVIEEQFFSLAIVDLRMDGFNIDGLSIIQSIKDNNPFARVIVVSAYTQEYYTLLQPFVQSGMITYVSDKKDFETWIPELSTVIKAYYESYYNSTNVLNESLLEHYAKVKNESDNNVKGLLFEKFISLLFGSMGFNNIQKRVKSIDKELDIVIRNDTKDGFLSKFGKYIFVECKNKAKSKLEKNDLSVFISKVNHSAGMCELGIFCTTTTLPKTFDTEIIREANSKNKIIFITNTELGKLIHSNNKIETFKDIIDEQVKKC